MASEVSADSDVKIDGLVSDGTGSQALADSSKGAPSTIKVAEVADGKNLGKKVCVD